MEDEIFTKGVKLGGLSSEREIKILLCYLIKSVATPLTIDEIQIALLGESLVNYFALATSLSDLCELHHLELVNGAYHITQTGRELANQLASAVPLSVKHRALNAAITAQQWSRKSAQHKAIIEQVDNGFIVHCNISDVGGTIFSTDIYMPDEMSANHVRDTFIAKGDEIYRCMLGVLTNNKQLIQNFFI